MLTLIQYGYGRESGRYGLEKLRGGSQVHYLYEARVDSHLTTEDSLNVEIRAVWLQDYQVHAQAMHSDPHETLLGLEYPKRL